MDGGDVYRVLGVAVQQWIGISLVWSESHELTIPCKEFCAAAIRLSFRAE